MKKLRSFIMACLLMLIYSCGGGQSAENKPTSKPQVQSLGENSTIEYLDNQIIVKFKEGVDTKASGRGVLQMLGGGKVLKTAGPYALIELPPGVSLETALSTMQRHPDVVLVGPNRRINLPPTPPSPPPPSPSSSVTPNDPLFSQLWGLNKIQAPNAWNYTTGNTSVIVAVLDTGVDYTHPDLADNIWKNPGEICNNRMDDDRNGYVDDCYGINPVYGTSDPMDDNGHGTHVAGIIGAVGNNGVGVVGVNWRVSILACKFLSARGSGTLFDELECLNYVKDMKLRGQNIVAVNASYGYTASSANLLEKDAINELRNVGILFVAAAGNDSQDNDGTTKKYPCSLSVELDNVLCVAATDQNDNLAYFSNYGVNTVQVGAPGVDILSTYIGGSTMSADGTSMATPHVTGLAALLKSFYPSMGYLEIKNRIMSTVDTVPSLSGKVSTGGRINAYRAVTGYTLSITKSGTGSGTVASNPIGINCGDDCTETYPSGTTVTLTAIADVGSTFVGWSGDCSGTDTTIQVTMNNDKRCTATFILNQYTITTLANPPAGGSVSCTPNPVNHGSTSTCTITTNTGYTLQGVTGTCGGTLSGNTYTTNPITAPCTVQANFTLNQYFLIVNRTGSGTVTSNPVGINCGDDCSESYSHGTKVTLTATPASGSTFASWSGDCSSCGTNSTCTITMDDNKTCIATFNTAGGGGGGSSGGSGGGSGGGGCSMSYGASPLNALAWLLVPAFVLARRLRRS